MHQWTGIPRGSANSLAQVLKHGYFAPQLVPQSPKNMEGERGNTENFCSLSAGAYTTTFLVMVTLYVTVAVPKQDFQTRKQKNSFLVIVYSALFNTVIEALNLVFEKYLTEIQLPGNITQLLSIPQSSTQSSGTARPWRFPSHQNELQMLLQLTVSCSVAFLL